MARRDKIELRPALKAASYKDGQVVIANGFVKEVEDIETMYDQKTIVVIEHDEAEDTVFMNASSNNNLVDAYGTDDRLWINKPVKVVCKTDPKFKKLMLVIEAGH